MSRCKACNEILEDDDLFKVKLDNSIEDLCRRCLKSAEDSLTSEKKQKEFDDWSELNPDLWD